MALIRPWAFALVALCAAAGAGAAESAADRAFNAAANLFRDEFFAKAEAECADFVQKFPDSPRVPEAVLLQAESRLGQSNYAGAIELLSARLAQAGPLADQYAFFLSEARFRQGEHRAAADGFAKLLRDFPASPRCLEAAVEEAAARSKLGEWPRVVELLHQTNGVFQTTARTNVDKWVLRGHLLLSEAQLELKDYPAAEAALLPMAKLLLKPETAWQRQYLLCRIQTAAGRPDEALRGTTNLVSLATNASQPTLLAESVALQAGLFERLNRANEAIAAYRLNLVETAPPARQRQALLKITELLLAQNRTGPAMSSLEEFLAKYPQATSADLALLTLGELRLRQYGASLETNQPAGAATNAAAATNLQPAVAAFESLVQKFPQSVVFGKAQLNLGWCYWLTGKMPEAQAAFQAAIQRLPVSAELADAHFKLGDAQFRQQNYAGALTNYQAVTERFAGVPVVQSNLFEPALYQTVRAALAKGDQAAATNALQRILADYPQGFHTDRAVLLTGQDLGGRGNPAVARQLYADFIGRAPNAELRPEIELAMARTYEQQEAWTNAIQLYDAWVRRFTNHLARPQAEFFRAQANFRAGNHTNALALFTNFVARFPTNDLAPLAQWWVADYYFQLGQLGDPAKIIDAEKNYQLLFQNWPASELTYQARLMAGRAAVARQGWKDATNYFTSITATNDPVCPVDLRIQAMFALGDTLMNLDTPETNKLGNLETAIGIFNRIGESYPSNQLALLAAGEKAICLLQWAQDSRQYDAAIKAFREVLDSPRADANARGIARIGLGVVFEKQAENKAGEEKIALLNQALNQYLEVFYYEKHLAEGGSPDLFWVKKAGLEAIRVAETLQLWPQVVNACDRLGRLLPVLKARLEKSILRAREHMPREG